jgi:hypothetical protein
MLVFILLFTKLLLHYGEKGENMINNNIKLVELNAENWYECCTL